MYKEFEYIPNTNNRYYATIDGHVFDCNMGHYVAENKCKRGWIKCHVWMDGKRITIGIHRLVAYAYLGISDLTVNHIDGDKENNSIYNLEYQTVQEQNWHRSRVIRRGNQKPIKCIEQDKVYNNAKEFCEINGFDYKKCHISQVAHHRYGFKTWKGYHFEFV